MIWHREVPFIAFSFAMAGAGSAWAHGLGALGFVLVILLLPPFFGMVDGYLIGLPTKRSILSVGLGALAGIAADVIALFFIWSL